MDPELGAGISRTRDDPTSEFRLSKETSGPLFLSQETRSKYILTAYLKGYCKESIDISINEDGTQIAVGGERPAKEKLIMGWIIYEREAELKSFRKAFYIPDRVILDRIKAKFDDQESVLKIVMPKRDRGIFQDGIKEVEEIEPCVIETSKPMSSEEKQDEPKEEIPPPAPPPAPPEPEPEPEPKPDEPSLCNPLLAVGSTLLISIIMLIWSYIRDRKK